MPDSAPKMERGPWRVLCSCGWSFLVSEQWMAESPAKLHQRLGLPEGGPRGQGRRGSMPEPSAEAEEWHQAESKEITGKGKVETVLPKNHCRLEIIPSASPA